MVSFSCEGCGDVLTKKKLDPHRNQCYRASFTCLDCMVHFEGHDYRTHTSCISEAQKYQGALYRPEKEKKGRQSQNNPKASVPPKPYVEDVDDDYRNVSQSQIMGPPIPEALSPPSATPDLTTSESPVNVFDFLVNSSTSNNSVLDLSPPEPMQMTEDRTEDRHEEAPDNSQCLVRVHFQDDMAQSASDLIEYGSGPVTTVGAAYQTPVPKEHRRKERKDRGGEKYKKRKYLHVDTQDLSPHDDDEMMTDAPPVLHSGLTGGLNRLMSHPAIFPPPHDHVGDDARNSSPGVRQKKTKHVKNRGRVESIGSGLRSLISTRNVSENSHNQPKKKHRKRKIATEGSKMIEYKSLHNGHASAPSGSVVLYEGSSSRAELLLSLVNKGPESDRGVSMNKALKRYHRERQAMGSGIGKATDEKELWRSLRMKRNDKGEIVLFM